MDKKLTPAKGYQIAKNLDNKIDELQGLASLSFLYIGKILKELKEKRLYQYLGEDIEYQDFESYVQSKGIQLRKAYYLIQIYSTFIIGLQYKPEELSNIYWTTLRTLLPVVDKDNSEELLAKARSLKRSDLDIEIKQLRLGLTLEKIHDCQHLWKHIIREYWECEKCRERTYQKPKGKIKEDIWK